MIPRDASTSVRLLCDLTTLRLARWLRLLGYDTASAASTEPIDVLRAARGEDRLVLTRSRVVAGQRGLRAILLDDQDIQAQIAAVQEAAGPPDPDSPMRCAACNAPLEPLEHGAAEGRVPPYVWRTQTHFAQCPACRRVYWVGSHHARIHTLSDIPR